MKNYDVDCGNRGVGSYEEDHWVLVAIKLGAQKTTVMISDIVDAKSGRNEPYETILNKNGWVFPPVVLEKNGSGELFLVDGHKRVGSALFVGMTMVPAVIVSQDALNEFLMQ
jgi:hypothetical protein